MANRKGPPLKFILVFHNLILTFLSGLLAFLILIEVLRFREKGYSLFHIYCGLHHRDQKGLLMFLCYLNHLLKYYELLDTIFLALKHKPISFLHAFHHPGTLVLTWGQLVDSSGPQWLIISLNLIVHTVMYFYYFMAALHISVPFKQSVTILQITQFILDLFACYGAWGITAFSHQCSATFRAGFVGCFILTSYLYLFVDFYCETYPSKPKLKEE